MNRKELKKAYDEKLISEDRYKDELFKTETSPKKSRKAKRIYECLSEEEFVKLLKYTRKDEHRIAFILAYGGGLRISEIVGGKRLEGSDIIPLQPEDVDLKSHKIFIRQGKGSKDRITYAPKWLKQRDLSKLPFTIGKRTIEAAFLRISLKAGINRQIDTFERGGKEVPIYRFHFHCLRSSFCTRLLNEGVPAHHVSNMMGHENLATTSVYAKSNPVDAIEQILRRNL